MIDTVFPSRAQLRADVRRQFESLPEHLLEPTLTRAFGVPIISWDLLTQRQVLRLHGAIVAMRLIHEPLA